MCKFSCDLTTPTQTRHCRVRLSPKKSFGTRGLNCKVKINVNRSLKCLQAIGPHPRHCSPACPWPPPETHACHCSSFCACSHGERTMMNWGPKNRHRLSLFVCFLAIGVCSALVVSSPASSSHIIFLLPILFFCVFLFAFFLELERRTIIKYKTH